MQPTQNSALSPGKKVFRLTPHVATEEEIRKTNELFRPLGWRSPVSGDVEQTLQQMERVRNPSDTRIYSWLLHPDERIAVAALKLPFFKRAGGRAVLLRQAALLRALEINSKENLVWNPLLDAFDAKNLWPGNGFEWEVGPIEGLPVSYQGSKIKASMLKGTQRLIFAKEIAGDASGERARELLSLGSGVVVRAIAAIVSPVPEPFIEHALSSKMMMEALLQNKALTDEQASRMRVAVLREMIAEKSTGERSQTLPKAQFLVNKFIDAKRWNHAEAAETLISLLPPPPGEGEEASPLLIDTLNALTLGAIRLNSAHLKSLTPYFSVHWLLRRVAEHPNLAESEWEEIAQTLLTKGLSLLSLVNSHPTAFAMPLVANNLSFDHLPQERWAYVLSYGHGPLFRSVVQSVFQGATDFEKKNIWSRIRQRLEEQVVRDSIYGVDLAPVLALPYPEVREEALRAVGKLRSAPEPAVVEEKPVKSTRKQRKR